MALHGNPKSVATASHGSHATGKKRAMGGVKRGMKMRQHGGTMKKGKK